MSNTSSGGIGFFGLLGILFIGLKLGGIIDWSWWFVLMPLYGGLLVAAIVFVVAFIMVAACGGKIDVKW